jgi:sulfopyruvate decarboxylase subunit beta
MIDSLEAQQVLAQYYTNQIVVTVFTSNREWRAVCSNQDLVLEGGETMAKASSIGLGLALAQPGRKVIVLDGDGSLLMNLGSLVTIANMAPPNLIHFVFENGVYRTTGGQPTPNARKISFMGLAKAAGYPNVYEFDKLQSFREKVEMILGQSGPTFVCLKVPPATQRASFPLVPFTPKMLPGFMAAVQRSAQ